MAMQWVNGGLSLEGQWATGKTPQLTSWFAHLYSNNHTPAPADTLANYTEVTTAGYGLVSLPASGWTFSAVGGVCTCTQPPVSFIMTAASTIFGYYVDDGLGNLLFAELIPGGPITLPGGGGTVTYTPKFTITSP